MRPRTLLFGQIMAHFSVVPMFLFAESSHYLWAGLVFFLMGSLGMSMTYHRLMAHQAWTSPTWFKPIGLLFGTLGLTGPCIAWAAVHRSHHQNADKITDPHSPHFQNFWKVQFLSMMSPLKPSMIRSFVHDPYYRFFHRNYLKIHLAYFLLLLVTNPFALIYAYLFPACILWNTGSLVNTLGHLWGYQNFETKDHSKNNPFLAFLTWGEGWHNNHHRYPKASFFGRKWFEIDISGYLIRLLEKKS